MTYTFTINYPFGDWMLGAKLVSKVCTGYFADKTDKMSWIHTGTLNELWIDFRFPWQHTSHFHRMSIPLSP